jgi:tartrate dehydrogenase/decarboxylase / D-malate dehydrogenase
MHRARVAPPRFGRHATRAPVYDRVRALTVRIAQLAGDGVGSEVVAQARRAVDCLGLGLEWTELDWGFAHWSRYKRMMPEDALDILREHDAILMGAVGHPGVPDTEPLWGLILRIRQELRLGANLRPVRLLDGVPCPLAGRGVADIDMLFVRENTEGEYAGIGGRTHRGEPSETAIEVSVFTRPATEAVMRFALERASERRGVLINATKSNASRYGYVFWDEVLVGLLPEFPNVRIERVLVDALCTRMVRDPGSVDVVVASNLFGDILTDLAAAFQGGLGMAPSASIPVAPGGGPALFEPVHGSAPDIAGRGIANPCGAIWSAVLMLEHLGHADAGAALMAALEDVCRTGPRTADIGGSASTEAVGDAIVARLALIG